MNAPDACVVRPWYRNLEPWLLLIAPAAAVIGGVVTLWLAIHSNDSLVIDDYYREGRAINQTFARDERAGRLGLSAHWSVDTPASRARLTIAATEPSALDASERLIVKLVHATDMALDHRLEFERIGPARWEAAFAAPARGRWTLQIEDPARSWRLTAALEDPAAPLTLSARASIQQSGPGTTGPR